MRFDGLILDFDGVLIESEYVGNKQIADYLTGAGHPTTTEEAMTHFMGLSGADFHDAVERWIGRALPDDFHAARAAEDARVLAEGVEAVAGAVAFVESLPDRLPRAIASSSSVAWIRTHLAHLGIAEAFGQHVYSGKEHVGRGKPAPDIYLHAAQAIGVAIGRCVVVEDSPVGVTGAVASGATVIGLVAGSHCLPGHEHKLRRHGAHSIARGFDEVASLIA